MGARRMPGHGRRRLSLKAGERPSFVCFRPCSAILRRARRRARPERVQTAQNTPGSKMRARPRRAGRYSPSRGPVLRARTGILRACPTRLLSGFRFFASNSGFQMQLIQTAQLTCSWLHGGISAFCSRRLRKTNSTAIEMMMMMN